MRLLFITSRFPWPLTKGDKLRAWNQIKYLSRDNEIILFSITQEKVGNEWIEALKPYCSRVIIHNMSAWKIPFNLLRNIFSGLPFQSMYYYNPRILKEIKQVVKEEMPERIMFQLIRTAPYADHFESASCVIDLMDCLSYHYLLRSNNSSFIKRLFYQWEYKKIKNFEEALLEKYDNIVIISEKDKALLSGNRQGVQVIANGVHANPGDDNKLSTDILFVGNMNYAPNIAAAQFLISSVLPLLKVKKPDIKLTIVGVDANKKLNSESENVSIIENVSDTRPFFAGARIFVAPMYLSTGIQNKVLEAIAANIPVITSPNAAVALSAVNDFHLLTAVSAKEFSQQVLRLMDSPALASFLTHNARSLIAEMYDWQRNTEKLRMVFERKIPAEEAAIF